MEISPPTDGEPPKPTPRDGFGDSAEPEPPGGFTGLGVGGPGPGGPVAGGAGPRGTSREAAGRRRPVPVAGDQFQRRGGAQGVVAGCRSQGAETPRVQAWETGPMGVVVRGRGRPPATGSLGPPYRKPGGPVPRSPWDCLRFPRDCPGVHRDRPKGPPGSRPRPPPRRAAPWAPGPASCHRPPPRPASRSPLGAGPRQPAPRPPGRPPSPAPAPASRGPTAVPPP